MLSLRRRINHYLWALNFRIPIYLSRSGGGTILCWMQATLAVDQPSSIVGCGLDVDFHCEYECLLHCSIS